MSGAAARVIAVLFVLLEETARRVHLLFFSQAWNSISLYPFVTQIPLVVTPMRPARISNARAGT